MSTLISVIVVLACAHYQGCQRTVVFVFVILLLLLCVPKTVRQNQELIKIFDTFTTFMSIYDYDNHTSITQTHINCNIYITEGKLNDGVSVFTLSSKRTRNSLLLTCTLFEHYQMQITTFCQLVSDRCLLLSLLIHILICLLLMYPVKYIFK